MKNNPFFPSYIYQIFTVFLLWKIMQKHIKNIKDKWNEVPILKEHRIQCNYSHLVCGIYSKYWGPSKSFCCVGFSYWYIRSGTKTEKYLENRCEKHKKSRYYENSFDFTYSLKGTEETLYPVISRSYFESYCSRRIRQVYDILIH